MREMRLADFVSGVITEVLDGVAEAQKHASEVGAKVNPILSGKIDPGFYFYDSSTSEKHFGQLLAFDVSVTTAESEGGKGGIGLFAGAVAFGTQAEMEGSREDAARIKFAIPVIFPIQE